MKREHLLELWSKEETYWWHVNKRLIVRQFLKQFTRWSGSLLDVGCGSGFFASLLNNDGWRVITADISLEAVRFARERGVSHSVVFDANGAWPFSRGHFDALLLLDVLEHIEDDVAFLIEARMSLRPRGTVVLTVPAHQFLFSSWDVALEHKRRYSRRQLYKVSRAAGLQPVKITYWNAISLLPALVVRGKDRLWGSNFDRAEFPEIPWIINEWLKWWGCLESHFISRMGLAFGLSLVGVLQKSEECGHDT